MILTKFRSLNLLGLADRLRGLDRRAVTSALAPFDKAGWSETMWREFWGDWRAQAIPERLRGAGGQIRSASGTPGNDEGYGLLGVILGPAGARNPNGDGQKDARNQIKSFHTLFLCLGRFF